MTASINHRLSECRDCKGIISREALHCPRCGCPWPDGRPADFFESNRKATLRQHTKYKFARAMVNACVFVWLLGCVVALGFAFVHFASVGPIKMESDDFVILGLSVGSALVVLFLGQLFHALFDIADAAVNHNKP